MAATDDELRFHREQRQLALDRLGVSDHGEPWRAEGRRRAAELYDTVITPPEDADYRTPEHFARTLTPQARRELAELLGALRDFRTQLVGLPLGDAQVLYNGDGYALLIGSEFNRWVTAHARSRLAKPSPRDNGNPAETFARLQEEFGVWFEDLVLAPGTGHMIPLSRSHKKLSWELYRGTWSRFVVRNGKGLVECVNTGNHVLDLILDGVLQANHWHRDGLIGALAAEHPTLAATGDRAAVDAELRAITRDLVEMCGLLSRSFRPSTNVIELAPGIFAGWHWEVGHLAGTINLGPAREEVAEQLDSGTSNFSFSLDMDGTVREACMPWLDLGPDVARWALGIARPVHAHLLTVWDAAERPASLEAGGIASPAEGEAIAAACEALALADVVEADDGGGRMRVPAVRTVTLLALLERAFAVEVKRGKGSEITVYKPGGRKYTLPNHKRNVHFPSHIVRAMLRALGIDTAEFCAAAGLG